MKEKSKYQAVVIGVSAGGFNALHEILPKFPSGFSLPVIIVQHRMDVTDNYLSSSLDRNCQLSVKDAEDKEKIRNGRVYIAPPGYHLLIEEDKTFALCVDEPVNYSRPSINVLFESAADVYEKGLIAVVLTGANDDGSKGVREIKKQGGLTIAQEPSGAEVDVMPKSAIETSCIDFILPLEEIPDFINSIAKEEL